ncbi:beta-1,4-galactosyltransferase 4-like [Babylonia areolata]|uniref:beta-1,4-galactosyltransferase 4-like n=1 Tax=Babylonia areolata TaxID=304850 RepID=UPI003FD48BFE
MMRWRRRRIRVRTVLLAVLWTLCGLLVGNSLPSLRSLSAQLRSRTDSSATQNRSQAVPAVQSSEAEATRGAHNASNALPPCLSVPAKLQGFKVVTDVNKDMGTLEDEWSSALGQGGNYRPPHCQPEERTAIIIPCRNRWTHVRILLNHLIPFLIRQQVSFTLFVIELDPVSHFNRGLLFNAGVREAMLSGNYTCFIMHDADMIPLNDHNLYRCGPKPKHMCSAIDKYNYKLRVYHTIGGVAAITREQFEKVNGFSNTYFGWGFEDNDLYMRLHKRGYTVYRHPPRVGQYHMISHSRDNGNEVTEQTQRLRKINGTVRWMDRDGLRQVLYRRDWIQVDPLYTWIRVTVNEREVIKNLPAAYRNMYTKGLTFIKRPYP